MSNKDKNQSKETKQENYYDLKTDAINRLVNADSLPRTKVTSDPGKEFRSKSFLNRIPSWLKALFIKFWFNGAVCFFVFWGLAMYIPDFLDMMIVFGVILGIVTDILVNNTLRFLEINPGQNSKWMMFPKKKFWTFFANIAYAILVLFCVFYLYNTINYMIIEGTGDANFILGVEPIAFGLLYLLVDFSFISIKNMMVSIIEDAIEKNKK